MSFLEEYQRVQDKIPPKRLSRSMLVGIVCLVAMISVLTALGVASTARGDFIVGDTASSSSAASISTETDDAIEASSAQKSDAKDSDTPGAQESTCWVYVVGAVKKPGVYELDSGARVNDVVAKAGGLTKSADGAAVNLARPIVDGERIYIPVQGEQTVEHNTGEDLAESTGDSASRGSDNAAININTASESELESLPGIGEVMAGRIVQNRETEGPFASKEDLKRVSGIGEKKYASLADLITV